MSLTWMFLSLLWAAYTLAWKWRYWRWRRRAQVSNFKRRARQLAVNDASATGRHRKPEWVVRIVIGLGVHGLSCRKIADNFNRRFGNRITIGKTWTNGILRAHALEIADQRRAMRRKPPKFFKVNHTWALDLSFYTSAQGVLYTVLGIIDHGSRRLLCLKQLSRK